MKFYNGMLFVHHGDVRHHISMMSFIRNLRRYGLLICGLLITSLFVLISIFAHVIAYDPNYTDISQRFEKPSIQHPFGTDYLGRDVWSRMVYGTRISLKVSFFSVFIALVIGVSIGLLAGYLDGLIDNVVMRIMDAIMSLPLIMVALLLRLALGPSINSLILIIGIIYIPAFARTVRGSAMIEKEKAYIEASRALGASQFRIVFLHILPNIASPIIILTSIFVANAILVESSLSFLGVGVSIFEPSWGGILNDSKPYMQEHSYLAFLPGMMISLAVLGFNSIGDGVREIV